MKPMGQRGEERYLDSFNLQGKRRYGETKVELSKGS